MALVDDRPDAVPRTVAARPHQPLARPPRSAPWSPRVRSAAAVPVATCSRRSRLSARCAPRRDSEHSVDLVHDHGAHGAQHLAASCRREQQVERLGRGDQDMRRGLEHRRSLGGRRVARADRRRDPGHAEPHLLRQPADLAPRLGQVPVDVGAQRLERGDVEDPGLLRQGPGETLPEQPVQLDQEGRESLAGARGSGDQSVPAGADRLPALPLRRGRLAQALGEPAGDDGVKG